MPELSRSHLVLGAVVALAVVVLGVVSLQGEGGRSAAAGAPAPSTRGAAGDDAHEPDPSSPAASGDDAGVSVARAPAAKVLVHVAGAVAEPGVYALSDGDRVQDAVRRAGGTTGKANRNAINLAAKVADGQQVVVPERAPAVAAPAGGEGATAAAGVDGASDGGAAPAIGDAAAGAAAPATPVGLNAATLDQLQTLDGVGPATAAKIIAWRTEHGGFRSVDDLAQVPGIGPKKLAAIRPHVQP